MRDLNDFREKTVRGEDLTFEEIQARAELHNPYDDRYEGLDDGLDEALIHRTHKEENTAFRFEEIAGKEIVLGDTPFKIVESQETITFFNKKTAEGCVLYGNTNFDKFDKAAIKVDLEEYFKHWHGEWDVAIGDVAHYFSKQLEEGNGIYSNITHQDATYSTFSDLKSQYEEQQKGNIWIKTNDKQYESEPDEKLEHTFGNTTVEFGIRYPLNKENPVNILILRDISNEEPNGAKIQFYVKGNIDSAEILVDNAIKHFDKEQDISFYDIGKHLSSQIMGLHQEAEFSSPQDFMNTVQLAKKAGYVQGVCECVAAIGDDHTLGKKLLSEMNVTKDMAKKFSNPETYKALEQGIFAPQQKLEQTHSIKR